MTRPSWKIVVATWIGVVIGVISAVSWDWYGDWMRRHPMAVSAGCLGGSGPRPEPKRIAVRSMEFVVTSHGRDVDRIVRSDSFMDRVGVQHEVVIGENVASIEIVGEDGIRYYFQSSASRMQKLGLSGLRYSDSVYGYVSPNAIDRGAMTIDAVLVVAPKHEVAPDSGANQRTVRPSCGYYMHTSPRFDPFPTPVA